MSHQNKRVAQTLSLFSIMEEVTHWTGRNPVF